MMRHKATRQLFKIFAQPTLQGCWATTVAQNHGNMTIDKCNSATATIHQFHKNHQRQHNRQFHQNRQIHQNHQIS